MENWWTGGFDIATEGDWHWMRSFLPVGDFVWANRQPDGGMGHDCLAIYASWENRGCDIPCDYTSLPVFPICQLRI